MPIAYGLSASKLKRGSKRSNDLSATPFDWCQEDTRLIKTIHGKLFGIFAAGLRKLHGHSYKLLYIISHFNYPSYLILFIIIKPYKLCLVYFACFYLELSLVK